MASSSDREAFLARFGTPAEIEWSSADEASRLSIQRFAAEYDDHAKYSRSRGLLRIMEEGREGSSARLEQTGRVLMALQRAVRGVGAGLEGTRALQGNLPASVVRLTYLRLVAAPQPGSVVVEVEPEVSPFDEAFPDGQGTLTDPGVSLADRSAGALVRVLSTFESRESEAVDSAAELLQTLGPRAAASIKAFVDSLTRGGFNVELAWEQFDQPSKRATVDLTTAALISSVIDGRALDAEPITLIGVLHTVSDLKRLDLQVPSGDILSIDRGDVDVSPWRVGESVSVDALARVQVRPAGDERRTYTALRIAELPDGEEA